LWVDPHHGVLRAAAGGMSTAVYLSCHLPISLHFGWITAAAVVNLNSLVAVVAPPPHKQLSFAFASVWVGEVLINRATHQVKLFYPSSETVLPIK
jgi:hypothetical protein